MCSVLPDAGRSVEPDDVAWPGLRCTRLVVAIAAATMKAAPTVIAKYDQRMSAVYPKHAGLGLKVSAEQWVRRMTRMIVNVIPATRINVPANARTRGSRLLTTCTLLVLEG